MENHNKILTENITEPVLLLSNIGLNSPDNLLIVKNKSSYLTTQLNKSEAALQTTKQLASSNLFRLCVKNGEYIYARANDIIIIESCDHLVKVHLALNDKIKKATRQNTLKDFLLQLPSDQFMRIGRFCAVNTQRLTGGNYKNQTFEFDFTITVKLRHALSQAIFKNIGR